MTQQRKSRRWYSAILIGGAALALTILLQQPAQSPAPDRDRQAKLQDPVHQTQAEEVAKTVRNTAPVSDVQVAVRNGTAIIAIKPQAGLTESEHRSVERQIADEIPDELEGIRQTFVTTDPNVYARVQRLQDNLAETERRVGPRMTEANLQWGDEFDDVMQIVLDLPHHAQGTSSGKRAGAAVHPKAIDGTDSR